MKKIFTLLVFLTPLLLSAQTRIDGDFSFETDPAKKYSLYIPSGYDSEVPNKVMLALHPFNVSRWDGESWCDTLTAFAEANQLILICPDGGLDGQIDDPIDTAFTSALIDSTALWYNLSFDKFYGMGFSWGSRGLYTYGLSHGDLIKGYIPVGAAINGTSEVNETLQLNATGKPFYIVHGSLDSPAIRFYPVRDSLLSKGAIVEDNLLDGVGHTIDFSNRNEILTTAFIWIDSVNCSAASLPEDAILELGAFELYPNPLPQGDAIRLELMNEVGGEYVVQVVDIEGRLVSSQKKNFVPGVNLLDFNIETGVFFINVLREGSNSQFKLIVE